MNKIAKFFRDYAFARFAIPAGLILIVFGYILFGIVNTRKDYPQTTATVTKVELYEEAHWDGDTEQEATYQIFVKYTVDGTEYEEELGILPEMKVGQTVKIDYDPKDPHNISQPTGAWLPIAIAALGIVALIAGIVSVVKTRKKNIALKHQEKEWANGN